MQMSSSVRGEEGEKHHDEEQIAGILFLVLRIIWGTDEFILLRWMETKDEFASKSFHIQFRNKKAKHKTACLGFLL